MSLPNEDMLLHHSQTQLGNDNNYIVLVVWGPNKLGVFYIITIAIIGKNDEFKLR